MLKSFLKEIADAFRASLGTTENIPAQSFPAKVAEVHNNGYRDGYNEGQAAMFDESKLIEATERGVGSVSLYDVSEIPHDIAVECGADFAVYGKNFLHTKTSGSQEGSGITVIYNEDGSITFKACVSTNTSVANFTPSVYGYGSFTLPAGTYTVSLKNADTSKMYLVLVVKQGNKTVYAQSNSINARTVTIQEGDTINLYLQVASCITLEEDTTVYPQLERGTSVTAYEQYKEPVTYTDGVVKSFSPCMNFIASGNADLAVTYRKSWGMYTEQNEFWETYQDGGNRTNYNSAFFGSGWDDGNYNPKYPLIVQAGSSMYQTARITDTKVPIDLTKVAASPMVFGYANYLETINKVIVAANTPLSVNCFTACPALRNITIEGEIGCSLNFSSSTLLTADSVYSIVDRLKQYPPVTQTLTLSETAWSNFLRYGEKPEGMITNFGDWETYITSIGWNLVLV